MTGHAIIRFLAAALLAVSQPAFGDAGAFQFVSGEVKIVRPDGREITAAKGAKILEGDTIVTGANGNAQLLMADEALISLRPDSTLRFDTYRYAGKEDGSEKGVLGLIKGGFRTLTGLIGRANKNNYLVRTPTATIGIRGTDHEPFFIPPAGWSGAPGGEPGSYDKVNSGSTFLQTEGGRIELGANQVGFAPPSPQALPTRLDRVPDFMRPSPVVRGQGERRGLRDGPHGQRRGPPPPGGGQMPPPPPGGLPPRSGDILPIFEPLAVEGNFGFNQAIADLSPAPLHFAATGGDKSGTFFGSGAGIVRPGGLYIELDPDGNPALIADTGGGFRYARIGAPLVHSGGTTILDGVTPVEVKWGIYAGGVIVDNAGPRAANYFHFSGAQGTPPAMAATLTGTYSLAGSNAVINENGVVGGAVASATIALTLAGKVTSYAVAGTDGQSRAFSASCPSCSGGISLSVFATNGIALTGLVDAVGATGNAHGLLIGPNGRGLLSSFDLTGGGKAVTGSFLAVK